MEWRIAWPALPPVPEFLDHGSWGALRDASRHTGAEAARPPVSRRQLAGALDRLAKDYDAVFDVNLGLCGARLRCTRCDALGTQDVYRFKRDDRRVYVGHVCCVYSLALEQ
jgi:hypothetical protein